MTGSPDGYLDWPAGRTDQENRAHAVTGTGRLAGSGRAPGSRVIAFATWLLALLGAGLMYVSFDAQYQFILAQKGTQAASLMRRRCWTRAWSSCPRWASGSRGQASRPGASGS